MHQLESTRSELVIAQRKVSSDSSTQASSKLVEMYKDHLDKKTEQVAQLENTINQLRAQMEQERQTMRRENLEEIDKLRNELEMNTQARNSDLITIMSLLGGEQTNNMNPIDSIQILANNMKSQIEILTSERDGLLRDNADLRNSHINHQTGPDATNSNSIQSTNNTNPEMVSFVQAQRDRLKTRVTELETERDTLKKIHSELNSRISQLVADSKRIENERNFWKSQRDGDVELGDMQRKSNPPTLFRKKSGQNFEQTFMSLVSHANANPILRRAGLVYLLTLHLLVFIVIYRLSSIVNST